MAESFSEFASSLAARFRDFVSQNDLELECDFVPATQSDVQECEHALGISFPAELRMLYMIVSDGGRETDVWSGVFGGDQWNSLDDIKQQMEDHRTEPNYANDEQGFWSHVPQVKHGMLWRPEWIIIGSGYDLRYFYLDTDPSPQGNFGQVLIAEHTSCRYKVIAPNLREFLELCLSKTDCYQF